MKLRFIRTGIALILCIFVAGCEATPTVPPFDGSASLLLSRTPPAISDHSGTAVLGATHLASEEPTGDAVVTATPAPIDISNCFVNGDYIGDLTIPDDTTLRPGEAFTKTWRLLNSGTCDWGTGFGLVFIGGAQMDGLSPAPVPESKPGDTVDLSVNMIAPLDLGTYTGVWKMQ